MFSLQSNQRNSIFVYLSENMIKWFILFTSSVELWVKQKIWWYFWIAYRLCLTKNVPPLFCYNYDTREQILIFFGRNVTDKVSKQSKDTIMPPQITCASALPGKTGNPKITFFSRCISALPEFHQLLLHFFNLFDSWLILTLLYDSLNLVTTAFSLELLWGMV